MSLYLACRYEDVERAQQLITNGANVNWRNPLMVSNSCTYNSWNNADILWCFMFGTHAAMTYMIHGNCEKIMFVITWSDVLFVTWNTVLNWCATATYVGMVVE